MYHYHIGKVQRCLIFTGIKLFQNTLCINDKHVFKNMKYQLDTCLFLYWVTIQPISAIKT